MTDERLSLMNKTRENLQSELEVVLRDLKLQQAWQNVVFELVQRKFEHLDVRSSFAVAIYEYIQLLADKEKVELKGLKDDVLFRRQLPFAAAMVITIQYLENHILDGKDGVKPEGGIDEYRLKEKLAASHYLKDFLYAYVRKRMFPRSLRNRDIVENCLERMFQITEEGQYAERMGSTLDNVQKGMSQMPEWSPIPAAYMNHELIEEILSKLLHYGLLPQRASFTRFYLQRVYCTNAAYFSLLAECVMDLAGFKGKRWKKERQNICFFAAGYGIIGQLINDIADYIPASEGITSVAKKPEDAYSDLRNHNYTLPFLLAVRDFEKAKTMLAANLYDSQVQKKWFRLVKAQCSNCAIPMLKQIAKTLKLSLHKSESSKNDVLLDFMNVVYNQRYLKPFKNKSYSRASPAKTASHGRKTKKRNERDK
ncbi:MAG TPA: polyprenyl synthetase family protein [Saprospiraceae bacterium]|nr:polyprenyl synthetase family protein [Saprospiraceae bacterium]